MRPDQSEEQVLSAWGLLSKAEFEIGGADQVAGLHEKHSQEPEEENVRDGLRKEWTNFVTDVQIRAGTLLKTDTVSILLGAGASRECGGVLMGKTPLEIERSLLVAGTTGRKYHRIRAWLRCFYLAVARARGDPSIPTNRHEILERKELVSRNRPEELPVNLEVLLSLLYRWRSTLPPTGGRLRLDGDPPVDVRAPDIDGCINRVTRALTDRCRLPAEGAGRKGVRAYRDLVRKILTRPLNLKRANVFTLNYDTLVEQAADAEGVVLIDGFVGTVSRVFRPESYDHDLYFPAQTTEGRVHRLDRVAHLYKLHGSVTWKAEKPSWDNPYGVVASGGVVPDDRQTLIYPTPTKFGETLGMPYAELFRRFAAAVVQPQSTLFVLGYGFGDEHVCAIIRQALMVPSFTLVVADPNPKSEFVSQLRAERDRRVWVFSGQTLGTFTGFVTHVLPDLRDEEIRRKVMATYRSLGLRSAGPETEEATNV